MRKLGASASPKSRGSGEPGLVLLTIDAKNGADGPSASPDALSAPQFFPSPKVNYIVVPEPPPRSGKRPPPRRSSRAKQPAAQKGSRRGTVAAGRPARGLLDPPLLPADELMERLQRTTAQIREQQALEDPATPVFQPSAVGARPRESIYSHRSSCTVAVGLDEPRRRTEVARALAAAQRADQGAGRRVSSAAPAAAAAQQPAQPVALLTPRQQPSHPREGSRVSIIGPPPPLAPRRQSHNGGEIHTLRMEGVAAGGSSPGRDSSPLGSPDQCPKTPVTPHFKEAPVWLGRRAGWFFGSGPQGVGYYRDPRQTSALGPRRLSHNPAQSTARRDTLRSEGGDSAHWAAPPDPAPCPPPAASGAERAMHLLWDLLSSTPAGAECSGRPKVPRTCRGPPPRMGGYCLALLSRACTEPFAHLMVRFPRLRQGAIAQGTAALKHLRETWEAAGEEQRALRRAPLLSAAHAAATADDPAARRRSQRASVRRGSARTEPEQLPPLPELLSCLVKCVAAWQTQPRVPPRPSPRAVPARRRPAAARVAHNNARHCMLQGVLREGVWHALARSEAQRLPRKEAVPSRGELRRRISTAPAGATRGTGVDFPQLVAPEVRLASPIPEVPALGRSLGMAAGRDADSSGEDSPRSSPVLFT